MQRRRYSRWQPESKTHWKHWRWLQVRIHHEFLVTCTRNGNVISIASQKSNKININLSAMSIEFRTPPFFFNADERRGKSRIIIRKVISCSLNISAHSIGKTGCVFSFLFCFVLISKMIANTCAAHKVVVLPRLSYSIIQSKHALNDLSSSIQQFFSN